MRVYNGTGKLGKRRKEEEKKAKGDNGWCYFSVSIRWRRIDENGNGRSKGLALRVLSSPTLKQAQDDKIETGFFLIHYFRTGRLYQSGVWRSGWFLFRDHQTIKKASIERSTLPTEKGAARDLSSWVSLNWRLILIIFFRSRQDRVDGGYWRIYLSRGGWFRGRNGLAGGLRCG